MRAVEILPPPFLANQRRIPMTDNHIFELEDNDEDFALVPDKVMSAVEAAAEKRTSGRALLCLRYAV